MKLQSMILMPQWGIWMKPPAHRDWRTKWQAEEWELSPEDEDKMERAHVLEPGSPGFESLFHYILVQLTVNKLPICPNSNILVYLKKKGGGGTTYLDEFS